MSVAKVIEISSESMTSFEEAIRNASKHSKATAVAVAGEVMWLLKRFEQCDIDYAELRQAAENFGKIYT